MDMSLALVPLTGLLLNYTPWGITLTPITINLATTALVRERQNQTPSKLD